MTDKEKKIQAAFNLLNSPAIKVETFYDLIQCHNRLLRQLDLIYEAGYAAGMLSKIKEEE